MWFIILVFLYILIALSMIVSLLVNGIRPSKTLAWLLAIFTIPLGGILLYLMLGRNRRKRRLVKRRIRQPSRSIPPGQETLSQVSEARHKKLMRLIGATSHYPPVAGNNVRALKDVKTTFDSIFKALEEARSYIHIQYYIYEDGELADRLLHLFRKKISEGVRVRLIYDGIGSYSLSRKYLLRLREAGVEVYSFLPFRFGRFLTNLNYRNHRKIIVVDGKTGFTGGINISDKYLRGDEELGMWHDMHLRIEGPAVFWLDQVFASDWYMVTEEKPGDGLSGLTAGQDSKSAVVQVVPSGPDDVFANIEQVYFSMICGAESYIYITNPYIIPSQEILKALQVASLSGVDIRLMISRKSDSRLVRWSVQSYFEPLLKAGVRIFLFPDGFLHSKILVCDDDLASVGTANIDVRSFEHNYEVNAVVYDTELAKMLKSDFLEDCRRCGELTYEAHMKRPWGHRLVEGVARVFTPLL